jgi:hypothetical protein
MAMPPNSGPGHTYLCYIASGIAAWWRYLMHAIFGQYRSAQPTVPEWVWPWVGLPAKGKGKGKGKGKVSRAEWERFHWETDQAGRARNRRRGISSDSD